MNAKTLYSLLASSALLLGADAGFAAGADDSLDAHVRATLRGELTGPADGMRVSRGSDTGPNAAEITRRVLAGEPVNGRSLVIVLAAEATPAQRSLVHADAQKLAQQFLSGRAG